MQRHVRFELKGSESTAGILPTDSVHDLNHYFSCGLASTDKYTLFFSHNHASVVASIALLIDSYFVFHQP